MSQAALGFAAGMHPQSVVKLEAGSRDPAFFSAVALAKALGVSVAVFEDTVPAEDKPSGEKPKLGRPRKTADAPPAQQAPPPTPPPPKPADAKPARGKGKRKG